MTLLKNNPQWEGLGIRRQEELPDTIVQEWHTVYTHTHTLKLPEGKQYCQDGRWQRGDLGTQRVRQSLVATSAPYNALASSMRPPVEDRTPPFPTRGAVRSFCILSSGARAKVEKASPGSSGTGPDDH